MELLNTTALPAKVYVGSIGSARTRAGLIVAKATFRFPGDAPPYLETQQPFPMLEQDHPTPFGLFPSDRLPREGGGFEVVVLGAAHASHGRAVSAMEVALRVGEARRALRVTGDRHWVGTGEGAVPSAPLAFERMPLTPERAWGGRCDVEVDRDSFVDVADPMNPDGRGFDPTPIANDLCASLNAPAGYPRLHAPRLLPNVEAPEHVVRRWGDAGRPAYWSAVPVHHGLQVTRAVDTSTAPRGLPFRDELFLRAHPDMVFAAPAPDLEVSLEGLSSEGRLGFRLPRLRVWADYTVEGRFGTRELTPQMVVITPDARAFCVVYRHRFSVAYAPGSERRMRLRAEDGWHRLQEAC